MVKLVIQCLGRPFVRADSDAYDSMNTYNPWTKPLEHTETHYRFRVTTPFYIRKKRLSLNAQDNAYKREPGAIYAEHEKFPALNGLPEGWSMWWRPCGGVVTPGEDTIPATSNSIGRTWIRGGGSQVAKDGIGRWALVRGPIDKETGLPDYFSDKCELWNPQNGPQRNVAGIVAHPTWVDGYDGFTAADGTHTAFYPLCLWFSR